MSLEAFSCLLETEELSDSNSSFSRRLGEGGWRELRPDFFFSPFSHFWREGPNPSSDVTGAEIETE